MEKTVYIAGPTLFFADHVGLYAQMKEILESCGLRGLAPEDNQVGLSQRKAGRSLSLAIYDADVRLMNTVAAGIFDLNPFRRGTEMDAGTAFEVGYMRALGKPLAGWTTDGRLYPEKVRDFMKGTYGLDLQGGPGPRAKANNSDELRDADGVLVHSEDMVQNLMVGSAIIRSGGDVFCSRNWQAAFFQAAQCLAKQLAVGRQSRVRV
jgi:nucleoside 2-deoxyribosyltransferase